MIPFATKVEAVSPQFGQHSLGTFYECKDGMFMSLVLLLKDSMTRDLKKCEF